MSFKQKIINKYRYNKPSGVLTMLVYRFGNFVYYKVNIPIVRHLLLIIYLILDILIVKLLCNAEFPARAKINRDIRLPHGSNGIIIHGEAVIGNSTTIFHQVTIGESKNPGEVPIIGDRVKIGVGAKILGELVVGSGAKIGANAVVLNNIPENVTAVGIPAKVK